MADKPSAKTKKKETRKAKEPKHQPAEAAAADPKVLEVVEGTTVKEFAEAVGKPPAEVIKMLIRLGEMITINQPISSEALNVLADELGLEIRLISPEEKLDKEIGEEVPAGEEALLPRAPVVTVMGHVDHGKTLLLDSIRETDVVSEEAGGITQHIGAYQVVHGGKRITFIDTPGHEAFTAMRARGAEVTDVAVLVVAADDGVKPQTVEAIDHARAARVPIIVAVNKIDKPDANPEKVRKELSELNLVPEDWGGDAVFVDVSAKKKTNLQEILDMILLVADLQELKANQVLPAKGVTIEAKLDKGRGPVATVLVQRGRLKVGNTVVAGTAYGKIRALVDDKGNNLEEALPSQPVEIIGLSSVPQAGDEIQVLTEEKMARRIAEERALKRRLIEAGKRKHLTLEELLTQIRDGEVRELNLVVKADVQGSIEAIREAMEKIPQDQVKVNLIHKGVGAVTESDVMLASASNAIVFGFNVRPDVKARTMAEKESVDIRTYQVIYKVLEDIETALLGLLPPEIEEVELGRAEIRETFKIPKIGLIAGCYVSEGEFKRGAKVRLVREGTIVYDGRIASLKRFKEDAVSVKAGLECGVGLEDFKDVKVGDVIEAYETLEKRPEKLPGAEPKEK